MTARIIGAPPERKRGAVFGDVPVASGPGSLCTMKLGTWYRFEVSRARHCLTGEVRSFGLTEPVILLTVTPAEPEPDPAVTTYGELAEREWFRFVASPASESGLCRRAGTGYTDEDGVFWRRPDALLLVRRVSRAEAAAHIAGPDASVVVHEEPGTHARRSSDPTSDLLVITCEVRYLTRDRAEHLCRQLAALLSAPEPTSDADPEPVPDRCPECGCMDIEEWWVGDVGGELGWSCPGCGRTTHPSTSPKPPEPTEDRSKPAPGFPIDEYTPGRYRVWASNLNPAQYSYPQDQSYAGATEHSWELDAEQARKAGESS